MLLLWLFLAVHQRCVPHCMPPIPVSHSTLVCDVPIPPYLEGQNCSVECEIGYGLEAGKKRTLTCQSNHQWSGVFAKCIKEKQFLVFLKRKLNSIETSHVCMASDEQGEIFKTAKENCQSMI